ncbi:MAG: hypothetical protein GPJ11_24270 [Microcystis aeruginosa L211-101]|jgi:hypothetical protein|nr:hypothetical protein [Microcystis aeruginosa L211-101]
MYRRRNHNYILPLEKSLPEALKAYGTRFGLTVAVYGVCLITFMLIININSILQAAGHFLYFIFTLGLSFIGYIFPVFVTFFFLKRIVHKLIEFLHMSDGEESKRTEDSDKLTRK